MKNLLYINAIYAEKQTLHFRIFTLPGEALHNLVFQKLECESSLTPNKRRVIEQSINFKTVMRVL
jgi:hypothetical protein